MNNLKKLRKGNWFERNPKKTIFFCALIILLLIFFCTELVLRLIGEKPGIIIPGKRLIKSAEELEIINPFFTDEKGVFKANRDYNWENGKYGIGLKINSDGFRSIELKKSIYL